MINTKIREIINLTPHEIKFIDDDGKKIFSIPSSGQLRAAQRDTRVDTIIRPKEDKKAIPVYKTQYGNPYYKKDWKEKEIPKKKEGKIYIVSTIACQALPNRVDFYIINKLVRDDNGNIIWARWISRNPYIDDEM